MRGWMQNTVQVQKTLTLGMLTIRVTNPGSTLEAIARVSKKMFDAHRMQERVAVFDQEVPDVAVIVKPSVNDSKDRVWSQGKAISECGREVELKGRCERREVELFNPDLQARRNDTADIRTAQGQ